MFAVAITAATAVHRRPLFVFYDSITVVIRMLTHIKITYRMSVSASACTTLSDVEHPPLLINYYKRKIDVNLSTSLRFVFGRVAAAAYKWSISIFDCFNFGRNVHCWNEHGVSICLLFFVDIFSCRSTEFSFFRPTRGWMSVTRHLKCFVRSFDGKT